jgi:hypothetical protein
MLKKCTKIPLGNYLHDCSAENQYLGSRPVSFIRADVYIYINYSANEKPLSLWLCVRQWED